MAVPAQLAEPKRGELPYMWKKHLYHLLSSKVLSQKWQTIQPCVY